MSVIELHQSRNQQENKTHNTQQQKSDNNHKSPEGSQYKLHGTYSFNSRTLNVIYSLACEHAQLMCPIFHKDVCSINSLKEKKKEMDTNKFTS
jgi:hypothetical protein